MPHCENCEGWVTQDFARVFGDNAGRVHACTECTTAADLYNDAGAGFNPAERSRYHGNGSAPGDGGVNDE